MAVIVVDTGNAGAYTMARIAEYFGVRYVTVSCAVRAFEKK